MLLTSACVFGLIGSAIGDTFTDLVGDKDGFGGQTVSSVPPDGTSIGTNFDNRDPSDPILTDVWANESFNPITYFHTFSPGTEEPVVQAFLDIQTAGMGNLHYPWEVFFNVNDLGFLIGDIGPSDIGVPVLCRAFLCLPITHLMAALPPIADIELTLV